MHRFRLTRNPWIPALLCGCILFLSHGLLTAQFPSTHLYGSDTTDQFRGLVVLPDSSIVAAGIFGPAPMRQGLLKIDADGNPLWGTGTVPTMSGVRIYAMAQLPNGDYVTAGRGESPQLVGLLHQYDAAGTLLRAASIGSANEDVLWDIQPAPNGGVAVWGLANWLSNNSHVWFAHLDSNWNAIARAEFDFPFSDERSGGMAKFGQNYACTWTVWGGPFGDQDGGVVVVNHDADTLWGRVYGTGLREKFNDVAATPDGGLLFAGQVEPSFFSNPRVWLLKTDAQGVIQWSKSYGTADAQIVYDLILDDDGNALIAGWSGDLSNPYDGFVMKADAAGNLLWSRLYGETLVSEGIYQLRQRPDGDLVALGARYGPGFGGEDMWLVNIRADGNSGCAWGEGFFTEQDHAVSIQGGITTTGAVNITTPLSVMPMAMSLSDSLLCKTMLARDPVTAHQIDVFPNPFLTSIRVRADFGQHLPAGTSYALFDALGRIVWTHENQVPSLQVAETLHPGMLPAGPYWLVIRHGQQRHTVRLQRTSR